MILQLESIYLQRTTQELQIVTMDEHPFRVNSREEEEE